MTLAVCFKCGKAKFGAFNPCEGCQAMPQSEDDFVLSRSAPCDDLGKFAVGCAEREE